ncbi:hypothetical protein IHC92_19785 [Photobacterium damselae subsp. damselae]|uniref:hypothetical protein n=1 Tax=Photobacterium damselae TaxID=38293 RepID=UPI001F262338|nr:hypothetical protein [Photobacterium damselae]UKA08415.1 hypothetical protein IHC90_15405 [Photobacterium damselae subsp. damselae]UKA23196.1 hypothetical protein IHC92_19785 [Photobacterium damselae subsp. damselae]
MKKLILNIGLILASTTSYAATEYTQTDSYTIQANRDYLADIPAQNSNGTVNAIIEIPTGSNQKWEVSKQDSSTLHWEFKNGQPRIVKYQAVTHYQKSNQSSRPAYRLSKVDNLLISQKLS